MESLSFEETIAELKTCKEFYKTRFLEVVGEKLELESKYHHNTLKLEQEIKRLEARLQRLQQNEDIETGLPIPEHIFSNTDRDEGPVPSVGMEQQNDEHAQTIEIVNSYSLNNPFNFDNDDEEEEQENTPQLFPLDPLDFLYQQSVEVEQETSSSYFSSRRQQGRRGQKQGRVKVEKIIKKKKKGLIKYADPKGRTRAAKAIYQIKLE